MSTDNRQSIDFQMVAEPLRELLTATQILMKRTWPVQYAHLPSARGVMRGVLAQADMTFQAIVSICADDAADRGRLPEHAVAAEPLARAILDAVFLVVFLFHDLPNRIEWYCKAGLVEFKRDLERHVQRYGDDPAWGKWLGARKAAVLGTSQTWEFPADAESKTWPRWPHPGGMISGRAKNEQWLSADRQELLTYLHEWFYVPLSWTTHISFPGVVTTSTLLLDLGNEEARVASVAKHRSDAVMTTLTLIVALVSEVQIGLQFDRAQQCRYVWNLLGPFWGPAQELYDRRYTMTL